MPKAILELEMPESCNGCKLNKWDVWEHHKYVSINVLACAALGKECSGKGRRSDCPLKLADEHLLKALSVDAGKDYHNPADVEVLKQARGALCDALDEVTYSREWHVKEAIAEIDKMIGGKEDV